MKKSQSSESENGNRIPISKIKKEFEYTTKNPQRIEYESGKESFTMVGLSGENSEERKLDLNELEKILDSIPKKHKKESDLIAFPNGLINTDNDGNKIRYSDKDSVISEILDLYSSKEWLEDKITAIGVDFGNDIKYEDNDKFDKLVMVLINYPGGKFTFFQCRNKTDNGPQKAIEPFKIQNRQLDIKLGDDLLKILFLSCGEVFESYFQKNYNDMNIVIDLAHESAKRKFNWRNRLEKSLGKTKKSCGFVSINKINNPRDIEKDSLNTWDYKIPTCTININTKKGEYSDLGYSLNETEFGLRLEKYKLPLS